MTIARAELLILRRAWTSAAFRRSRRTLVRGGVRNRLRRFRKLNSNSVRAGRVSRCRLIRRSCVSVRLRRRLRGKKPRARRSGRCLVAIAGIAVDRLRHLRLRPWAAKEGLLLLLRRLLRTGAGEIAGGGGKGPLARARGSVAAFRAATVMERSVVTQSAARRMGRCAWLGGQAVQ
jgi:hypothetical protein